ncbi:MAG: ABC transporter ATP-binding protein [Planctomycetales bacterium]|nr:ABC transporter ATP-binding protein [Planctomycetales bacterium]
MIRLEEVTKRFGRVKALDSVSLEAGPGDALGLVGPNGAGKTTLVRILATLTAPNSGKAFVAGHDVRREAGEARQSLGFLPETFGVYEGVSVRDYLDAFAAAYGVEGEKRETVVADLLALTDLAEAADQDAATLSRGGRQRLGLARALVHDPPVLLLDEPTAGLDPRARVEFCALLRELTKLGKTLLVSSHLLEDLRETCTHLAVLHQGRIVASGTRDKVLGIVAGRTPVEATFLGDGGDGGDGAALAAEKLLLAIPSVRRLERGDGRLSFEVEGGPEEVARVHKALVGAVPVVLFGEKKPDLLDVVLRLTAP